MPLALDRSASARVPFAAPDGAEFVRPVVWTIFPEGVASVVSLGGENREEVDIIAGPRDGVALVSASALMDVGGVQGAVMRYAQVVVGTPGDMMAELQAEAPAPVAEPRPEPAAAPAPTPTRPAPAAAPAQAIGAAGIESTAAVEGQA